MGKYSFRLIALATIAATILMTCQKSNEDKPNSDQIEEVTYSKNFDKNLSDENIWFAYNFETNSRLNSEIAHKKEIVQSFYVGYLLAVQTDKHEIYFKWTKVSADPLEYRLTAYLTPAPQKLSHDEHEGQDQERRRS